ncbi:hypothetical protein TWF481_009111 [Arthrobotrys musiformis]|uniref:Rhodopsin domain-containing protein n=1 Tax=Arthrobotrys musiformis TaxID=47236 RepID=A0AAV9W2S2_9PEZI
MAEGGELEFIPPEDLLLINQMSFWVGVASPKYSDLPILSIIDKYADLIISNDYNITLDDIVENFGTPPEQASAFVETWFGGAEEMIEWLLAISDSKSLLPHPRNIDIILPLFIAFTVITSLAVTLRMLSRHQVGGGLRSFDWLTFAGQLMTVIWGALAVHRSNVSGRYDAIYDRSWNEIRETLKMYLVITTLYPWVMLVIKMSLCLFYYRMTTMNYIRWGVWVTGFIVIGNTIAGFLFPLLSCTPVNSWDHLLTGTCKSEDDRRTALIAIGAIYIFTDVVLWALPIPMVFQLQLYPRQRILALCTFGVGAVACVASGFRLEAVIKHVSASGQTTSTLIIDAWGIIEMNIALICACAPAIRAYVIFYKPKVLTRIGSISTGSKAASEKPAKKELDSEKTEKKELDSEKAEI